jgi:hypothetical protein
MVALTDAQEEAIALGRQRFAAQFQAWEANDWSLFAQALIAVDKDAADRMRRGVLEAMPDKKLKLEGLE